MDSQDVKNILKESMDRISELMSQDKWLEAHRACLEILRFDPENIKIIRLKKKIEKNVRNLNRKALKDDLDKLMPYWKEGKYEEILPYLKKLEPYATDYDPLAKFMRKFEAAYKKHLISNQKEYVVQEISRIQQLASEGHFEEAVKAAEKLKPYVMEEGKIKKIVIDLRERWVKSELESHKSLLESEKYEDILLFLHGTLNIDDKSSQVRKLIQKYKKDYQAYRLRMKKDIIYKELTDVKSLLSEGKYEHAMEDAKDVVDMDPFNKEALALYAKAKRKAEKNRDKDVRKQMKSSRAQLKKEYRDNKNDFLKI